MKRSLAPLALVIAAGCASPLPQTPPAGLPARVDPPLVRAGEEWAYSYRDGYTGMPKGTVGYRIVAVKDDAVVVEVSHDGRRSTEVYTRAWGWRERPMTNLQSFRFEPAYPALPFPLEAGKTWRSYVSATDPATGRVNRVRIDGAVLGWERVRVPAGEFDALKIQRLVYAGNHDGFRGEERIAELDWYAPALGRVVRHESSSGHLDRSRGCDDVFSDCNWIRGDWNVLELVRAPQGAR